MKRLSTIGIFILLSGIAVYMVFTDEIPGVMRALIIGLTVGSGFALRGLFEGDSENK